MNGSNSSGLEPIEEESENRHRHPKPSMDVIRSVNSSTDTLDKLLDDDNSKSQETIQTISRDSQETLVPSTPKKEGPVSWKDLPRKGQLAILVCARMSEPLTQSSLRSYMYYQLQSFDRSLPAATIAWQAGALASAFTFAQFLTAVIWGKLADSEHCGRKRVLLIGLMGTGISAVGFGFSTTFWMALGFRFIGGVLNGNVGVMRTMVSEMIVEKKYQSRAFMIMPMTANIGTIIGPIIGGFLAEPVTSWPGIFGPGTLLGGKTGVQWMINYPYALPNLISACFLITSGIIVVLGLEETHYMLRDDPDWGLRLGRLLKWLLFRCGGRSHSQYAALSTDDNDPDSSTYSTTAMRELGPPPKKKKPQRRRTLPFHRIFTRNVVITLLSRGFLAMHIGAFANLWYVFLSTPRAKPHASDSSNDLFHFTGGLALGPAKIGLAMSILGGLGIAIQLFLYPRISHALGTINTFRASLLIFPVVYFVTPFLALVPSSTAYPLPASGPYIWAGILAFLGLHVLARTFAMPSATILVNNCCPHPSVLSTIHGVAQSVSSGFRMLGPIIGGWGFGIGLNAGVVGAAFWALMGVASLGALVGGCCVEGTGHDIVLEGDEWGGKADIEMKESTERKERRGS